MADSKRAVEHLVSLLDHNTLSLALWVVHTEKVDDPDLRDLILRIRSSLEYGLATKQLRGIVRANYTNACSGWKTLEKTGEMKATGDRFIASAEQFLKTNKIALI